MNKPLRAVIATIRARIGVQSIQKLPDEVVRLLVHDTITDYDNLRLNKKEEDDRFLHDTPCGISADIENQDFIVFFGEGTDDEVREFIPKYLHYYLPSCPNEVKEICLTTLGDFKVDSRDKFSRVGVFHGNNYDRYRLGMRLKLNMTPEEVARYSWKLIFEKSFSDLLSYDDPIPFPSGHIGLIEVASSIKCLAVVEDNSPTWAGRMAILMKSLTDELSTKIILYKDYLNSLPRARSKTLNQYNYKNVTRNELRGYRRGYMPPVGEE